MNTANGAVGGMETPKRNLTSFDDADGAAVTQQSEIAAQPFDEPPDELLLPETGIHDSEETGNEGKHARTKFDQIYDSMEALPFPEGEVKVLLGDKTTAWVETLKNALQLPFESVLICLLCLSAFALHRTETVYTPMLSLPPLPWFAHLGRTGDGKSILVWFQKQVVLELQDRINRQRRKANKEAEKAKESQPASEKEDDEDDEPEQEDTKQKLKMVQLTDLAFKFHK